MEFIAESNIEYSHKRQSSKDISQTFGNILCKNVPTTTYKIARICQSTWVVMLNNLREKELQNEIKE